MDGLDGNGTCVCSEAFQGLSCQLCSDPGKYGPQCDKGEYSSTASAEEHGLFLLDPSDDLVGVNWLQNSPCGGRAICSWGIFISYFKGTHPKVRVSVKILNYFLQGA